MRLALEKTRLARSCRLMREECPSVAKFAPISTKTIDRVIDNAAAMGAGGQGLRSGRRRLRGPLSNRKARGRVGKAIREAGAEVSAPIDH